MKITREWLALGIAVLALAVSASSAFFAYRADQRARDTMLPAVEWTVRRTSLREIKVVVRVKNTGATRADVLGASVREPKGGRIDGSLLGYPGNPKAEDPDSRRGFASIPLNVSVDAGSERTIEIPVFLPEAIGARDFLNFSIDLRVEVGNQYRWPATFTYTNIV